MDKMVDKKLMVFFYLAGTEAINYLMARDRKVAGYLVHRAYEIIIEVKTSLH